MREPGLEAYARDVAGRFAKDLLGALLVITRDGTILAWNDGATALFGYSSEDALGRTIFDTIVPPDLTHAKRAWLASAADTEATAYESVRRRKDGQRIWVDITLRVHREPNGECVLVLNERDITRFKYQRDAQVLETRFRGVLDAAPDAIVLVDTSGRIALVNSEAERLFGYARDELLGEFVERLVPSRFHKSHADRRAEYFADPRARPMGVGLELLGHRKDGSEFPTEISLSPLSIDEARLAMAVIRDVTVRKHTETALKVLNEELESFTYSVSHDLRAPIRQIDGFASLLAVKLGDSVDAETTRYVQRIQDAAQLMGGLVDDLLTLSRLGRQDLRRAPAQLGDIVSAVISDLQSDTGGRNIEWKVAQLPTADCDPGLIRVVFTNLLSNALKYTRPRERTVIEVGPTTHRGSAAVFVRDNGVGFDMQYADKLFGVFQRLHHADEFEGTGVGLATVQRIVRKHGGEIWADAVRDGGATFTFTLGRPAASVPHGTAGMSPAARNPVAP
jgi:PAS domain S-box-containing protein